MSKKINITYVFKGVDNDQPIFLPEHQGSGFTGDFTDEEPTEIKPIAYFIDDGAFEKCRVLLQDELNEDDEIKGIDIFSTEYGHEEFFVSEYRDLPEGHQEYVDLNIKKLKECKFQNDFEEDYENWERIKDVGMQLLWFYHINSKYREETFD
jgi:hypothetical protein